MSVSASENFMEETSKMALCLTKWKSSCIKCFRTCRLFVVIHKVEIITSLADILVSHPLVMLRRQCQVRADCQVYHLTPLTLLPVMVTLVQRNGCHVLFKGICNVVVLRVVQLGSSSSFIDFK